MGATFSPLSDFLDEPIPKHLLFIVVKIAFSEDGVGASDSRSSSYPSRPGTIHCLVCSDGHRQGRHFRRLIIRSTEGRRVMMALNRFWPWAGRSDRYAPRYRRKPLWFVLTGLNGYSKPLAHCS